MEIVHLSQGRHSSAYRSQRRRNGVLPLPFRYRNSLKKEFQTEDIACNAKANRRFYDCNDEMRLEIPLTVTLRASFPSLC